MKKTTAPPFNSDLEKANEILAEYDEITETDTIAILQQIQDEYGYLPADVMKYISDETDIPYSRIYGVATFYEQFHLEPTGRHTIRCCRGTACHVKGGSEVIKAIERLLKIKESETTDDLRFTFETVACLGTCFLAPAIMIDSDYYKNLKADELPEIFEKYK